jgi:hypothetical protein
MQHDSTPATDGTSRDGSAFTEGLGPLVERENVDDALMIVQSYGPWGADLNDAHRRQIVLADEVLRLRGLYEMAVRGRAEMRTALRLARDGYASEAATGLPVLPQWRERTVALIDEASRA